MATTTNVTVYLMAGEIYTIEIPVTLSNNHGYFPRKGTVSPLLTNKDEPTTLQNGFYVENEEVGTIEKVYGDKIAVDYKHKYSTENAIWFLASTGEKVKVSIGTMPVHDHASVVTGGPAYGTYFSGRQSSEEDS